MKYLIDSANQVEIDESLEMGICGITANPSLYVKDNVNFYEFLTRNSKRGCLLTGEVLGDSVEEMLEQAEKITQISDDIIIKLNYSPQSLKVANVLKNKGIKTAMTLVFDVNQALLSVTAGVSYLFLFVARNEELGVDGLEFVRDVSTIIKKKDYEVKIVAASIRTKYQLQRVAQDADYIAAPFKLIKESFLHPSTLAGAKQFETDMKGCFV
ncbi:transaldolase [Bacillus sp. HNG]|uniref:transaldolase family protein n=1 Tax=Bacillus sp. HNG TaxID=2293325 RepID=UPI000E2E71C6|nr:transaldolase family protein [Bacillus sp. HNG]RFB18015.1 transaldolase [Bacillus sp. HNG]